MKTANRISYTFGINISKIRSRLKIISTLAITLQIGPVLADCTFTGVSGINFGQYSALDIAANNTGVGSISISCHGLGPQRVIGLSTGQSNNFDARIMTSGANQINYNLYTNSARTLIWGDGNGASKSISVSDSVLTTLNIFGQIPANQDASVGQYSDSIIVTIDF
jgi:spore coat protein U-like protein